MSLSDKTNKVKINGLFLTFLICTLLSACGSSDAKSNSQEAQGDAEYIIDIDELQSYIRTEELTVDNWEEYFDVVEVEKESNTDIFGEETEPRSKYISLCVRAKDFVYGVQDDIAMRFLISCSIKYGDYNIETAEYEDVSQYDDTKEIDVRVLVENLSEVDWEVISILYQSEPDENNISLREEKTISEYSLEKIQGTIGVVEIPNEVWNTDEDGEQYIAVKSNNHITRIWGDHYETENGVGVSQGGAQSNDFYRLISRYIDEAAEE